jgi:hypothetical protein
MNKTVEELVAMSEEDLLLELGLQLREKGIDGLFDTSQIRDAKSWDRYYQLRKGVEEDYKEIFGHELGRT